MCLSTAAQEAGLLDSPTTDMGTMNGFGIWCLETEGPTRRYRFRCDRNKVAPAISIDGELIILPARFLMPRTSDTHDTFLSASMGGSYITYGPQSLEVWPMSVNSLASPRTTEMIVSLSHQECIFRYAKELNIGLERKITSQDQNNFGARTHP